LLVAIALASSTGMRVCTSCKRLLRADATRCPTDGAPAEVVVTLPRDTRLGAYKIDRVLGEGGMGFVYEATHEVLNRRSAIKMLRPELASHAQVVTRFLNEAKAVNLIDHQNIVNVYDYGDSQDGSVYFVMEFLEGETLDDLMRKRRPMPMPLLIHVFGQIARALAAAHAKQIVHRDLKPANVFIVKRENNPYFIKLLDFGIAQLRGQGAVQGLTLAGSVMGTPQYMSPEQISGGTVDARSDVWSLGVMLYRAATGHAPFRGEAFAELADRILNHPPQPAGELVALPPALSTLLGSCLQRRLEDRCPSIGDVLAGLEQARRECQLDEQAILAAVAADSGVTIQGVLPPQRESTRGSIGGSLPRYQGAPDAAAGPARAPAARRSRAGVYITLGAVAGALAGAAFVMRTRHAAQDDAPSTAPPPRPAATAPAPSSPSTPTPTTIAALVLAGDTAGWHRRAEADLRDAVTSDRLQQQGFAVDALAQAHVAATAPLLYLALKGPPDVRVKATRALGDLAVPDAAPRLREALAASGDRIRIDIAAAMFRLGDKDGRTILVRATDDPGARLTAALALAGAGDDGGRAALADIVASDPPGRDSWRRAAGGLVALGDAGARKLLEGELAQPDAERAVGAAELLARAGDAKAREQLARSAADHDFARRGDAAAALARLGDRRALGWVADGLASRDAGDRKLALAVCGLLAADAAAHTREIADLATSDPDPSVRMTAEAVLLGL
jgi:serine/threonine-protein kinase